AIRVLALWPLGATGVLILLRLPLSSRLLFPSFFFSCYRALRALHSFPTRRSSDLNFWGNLGNSRAVPWISFEYLARRDDSTCLYRYLIMYADIKSCRSC